MSNPNQSGNGDAPRPVNMVAFREHYEEISRKQKSSLAVPVKDDPLESEDHDNDDYTYAEQFGYP